MGNKQERLTQLATHMPEGTGAIAQASIDPIDPNERVRELFYVAQSMAVANGVPMTTELLENGGVRISPRGGKDVIKKCPVLPPETKSSTNANGNGVRRKKEAKEPTPEVLAKRQRRQKNMALAHGLYRGRMYGNGQKRGK